MAFFFVLPFHIFVYFIHLSVFYKESMGFPRCFCAFYVDLQIFTFRN